MHDRETERREAIWALTKELDALLLGSSVQEVSGDDPTGVVLRGHDGTTLRISIDWRDDADASAEGHVEYVATVAGGSIPVDRELWRTPDRELAVARALETFGLSADPQDG